MLSVTLFTSCATLFCKKRTVTVTSDVDGADVFIGSKYVGKTPFSYETKKTKMTITVQKEGYEPQEILTNRSIKPIVWLDCLAGGIPGIVDLCSGKYYKYKETDYFVSLKDPSINQAHNERINKKYEWVAKVAVPLAAVTMAGATAYAGAKQAENARKAAEEAQQRAAMEARWAEQIAQTKAKEEAKQKAEQARVYGGSNSLAAQMEAEKSRSQSRRMETSDLAQYNAARMSDATYGTAATNQALAQQRQYDAQQRQQSQSQQSIPGSVVNAVTSSGAHVQIKVNGNQVTAYSSGNNMIGPEWSTVVPTATVEDTSSPYSQTPSGIASKYAYQASIRGLGVVYWGTPTRRVVNDAPNGTPIKAVTLNGQTLTIMVNGNKVVAYGSGLNQASDIQWHSIVPNANIAETNSSFDGGFSTRFKYKANIPSIGTVYF